MNDHHNTDHGLMGYVGESSRQYVNCLIKVKWFPLCCCINFDEISDVQLSANEKEFAKAIIKEGYRVLSKKLHPDVGGDTEDMKTLNVTKTKLLNSI